MGVALDGSIALVTGASRGVGRGIALQLGEAGATVYITGRRHDESMNPVLGLPTLEQTAEEITRRGGKGVAVYLNHSRKEEVEYLFKKIEDENEGRLDVLVNNAYQGVQAVSSNFGKKFYEMEPDVWDHINDVGLKSHYTCSVFAARLMAKKETGLIINVGSLGGLKYLYNVPLGVGKEALDRLSADMAVELKEHNICVVSLCPGPVKTELVKMAFFDADGNLKPDIPGSELYANCETVEFVGKAIVRFALDPAKMTKSGKTLLTDDLAHKYRFADAKGMQPLNIRSVRTIVGSIGHPKVAKFIPSLIKVPRLLIWTSVNRL